jgi:hypothetical protein
MEKMVSKTKNLEMRKQNTTRNAILGNTYLPKRENRHHRKSQVLIGIGVPNIRNGEDT